MMQGKPDRTPMLMPGRFTWSGHWAILRVDHWFKNVFVLPGVLVACLIDPPLAEISLVPRVLVGLLAISLTASSNYTLNELTDGRFDALHPEKRYRPVPAGLVNPGLACVQWLLCAGLGFGLAAWVSQLTLYSCVALWLMGIVYNAPPLRSKDIVYVDVLTEAINNPIRFVAGFGIAGIASAPPASLLASYWMLGCYFMALKRFAELRAIGDAARAAQYRASFGRYTEMRLLNSVIFYAAASMLTFGAFMMRYRQEWLLAFPLVAWVMSTYFSLSFLPDSPVQKPEALHRQPRLMVAVVLSTVALLVLLAIDLPWLREALAPWGKPSW